MIEVRSATTAELLGYVPGHLTDFRVGDTFQVEHQVKFGDTMVKRATFRVIGVQLGVHMWECLNADGHSLELLCTLRGWKEAT